MRVGTGLGWRPRKPSFWLHQHPAAETCSFDALAATVPVDVEYRVEHVGLCTRVRTVKASASAMQATLTWGHPRTRNDTIRRRKPCSGAIAVTVLFAQIQAQLGVSSPDRLRTSTCLLSRVLVLLVALASNSASRRLSSHRPNKRRRPKESQRERRNLLVVKTMSETPAAGGDAPDAYEDETRTKAEAVCPACGSEAAEQIHETYSKYNCQECGAAFDASGGGQLIE